MTYKAKVAVCSDIRKKHKRSEELRVGSVGSHL
jgi:hypothetical protein